jgi:acetyl esterase/lipase
LVDGSPFARRGFAVLVVDYPLTPDHSFPAGLSDVSAAYAWMVQQAPTRGFALSRVVVAGESAGANLITSLPDHQLA